MQLLKTPAASGSGELSVKTSWDQSVRTALILKQLLLGEIPLKTLEIYKSLPDDLSEEERLDQITYFQKLLSDKKQTTRNVLRKCIK